MILTTQKENGQFGSEPWISTDQNVLWPLTVAWSQSGSRHFHDEPVLDAIVRGGLALQEAQDENGMWMFRKKDYSEWGPIRMPWAYSRWIRAFAVIKDQMPTDAHQKWADGLQLGYEGIAEHQLTHIHNIPTHHAMALYCAGQAFDRPTWCEQAADFLRGVASAQSSHGWWAEHEGPVVAYNFVYAEALGTYFAMSGDEQVLPALERAATYHATFTYPDGSCVETIDGRNPYHDGVRLGNAGLTRSAAGRGWTAQQHRLYLAQGQRFDADYAASMLAYATSGDAETPPGARDVHTQRMGDQALTRRRAPWFACVSAYTVDIPQNRWGLDRQSFFSLYHDEAGLIAGGGNSKLQPLWSTFTLGNTELLKHTPGEEDPDFAAVDGLIHCPQSAKLGEDDETVLVDLHYGSALCTVSLKLDAESAVATFSAAGEITAALAAHVTLLPQIGESLQIGEQSWVLGDEVIDMTFATSTTISHRRWQMSCGPGSRLHWPALPHNPYRKDGHSTSEEGRLVVTLPLASDAPASVGFHLAE
tara:strand:- start:268 stop:1863 length:1596 start_codon:yes stop_codon:yes gene_type:complete